MFFFQETGVVIIKNGLDQDQEDEDEGLEEESDSDSGLGASVPPCAVIFIGANVSTGKSSIKLRPRDKKVNYLRTYFKIFLRFKKKKNYFATIMCLKKYIQISFEFCENHVVVHHLPIPFEVWGHSQILTMWTLKGKVKKQIMSIL